MNNLGIFSGTFDPVHDGHIAFAKSALQHAHLDKVIFIAEPCPRRKRHVTALDQREAMLALALQTQSKLVILSAPWLKVHTIEEALPVVSDRYGNDNNYSLLMGGDVFKQLEQWGSHNLDRGGYQDIIEPVSFVVALRRGDRRADIDAVQRRTGAWITLLESAFPSYSSGQIRDLLATGQIPQGINWQVHDYIKEQGLYSG